MSIACPPRPDTIGLCFSTLGCPGETVERVLSHASVGGCTGVELRCRVGELIAPDSEPALARAVADALRAGGVEPVCLASYVRIGALEDVSPDLERHLRLAAAAGIPTIRVFGGEPGDPGVSRRAVRRLQESAGISAELGVAVLIETHDALLDGRSVAQVLDEAEVPTAGAIWDVLNPWRAGEAPDVTARLLAPWLRHVQIKDAASREDIRPLVPGTGAVPLPEILSILEQIDYRRWVSLEWEAAWYPDAPPLDQAQVAFASMMTSSQ